MPDPWGDVRAKAEQLKEFDKGGADLAPIDFALIEIVDDAGALLMFKGQAEAALAALEHGLTDAPEGILRDALAALPEHLKVDPDV